MKTITYLILVAMMLFTGDAMAVDLNGAWIADSECVPNFDAPPPFLDPPKYEQSEVIITQQGMFFTSLNVNGEICGGVISGKSISMTCQGTLFHGEFKPPNTIIGINHILDDGVTCSTVAVQQ